MIKLKLIHLNFIILNTVNQFLFITFPSAEPRPPIFPISSHDQPKPSIGKLLFIERLPLVHLKSCKIFSKKLNIIFQLFSRFRWATIIS